LLWGGVGVLAVASLAAILGASRPRAKPERPDLPAVALNLSPPANPAPTAPKQPQAAEQRAVERVTATETAPPKQNPPPPALVTVSNPEPAAKPTAEPPAPPPAAVTPPPVARSADHYGTCVHFLNNPAQAAQKAFQDQKLLFTVHISGNFDDSHFT
jgi:hypothetical protein